MWNNSIARLQLLAEQLADDQMALVSGISLDPEAATGVTEQLLQKWVNGVDEVEYEVGRIKQKMKELASLSDQHLNRPTLDDSSEQEHAIEITTQEITQVRGQIPSLQDCLSSHGHNSKSMSLRHSSAPQPEAQAQLQEALRP